MDEQQTQETTMTDDILDGQITGQTALVRRRTSADVVLMPVMNVQLAKQRLQELQEFCANYLEESKDGGTDGGDFGVIPGAGKKKVLFKSGSEKLCDVYGLADRYEIISKIEDFDSGLFDYTIECTLVRKTDEMFVGSGLGACSTWESKYRWRESQRTCPNCNAAAIIKGKEEYGGGWLCWAKKGGCGTKFNDGDKAIEDQKTGRVENPDIIDAKNTVLKIAKKRAKIDAVIGVTRSSGIFTQDLEEHELTEEASAKPTTAKTTTTGPHPPASNAVHTSSGVKTEKTAPAPTAPPANETHAEKIARIKKEAQAKQPAAGKESMPQATGEVVRGTGPAPATDDPNPTVVEPPAPVAPPAPTPDAPEGHAYITGINVRNGPMMMKDGKSQPSWGPLYIIAFSQKIKASDGTMVLDASTFTEADAAKAEAARDAGTTLKPVIEPGSKKGSFKLVRFD